MFVTLLPLNVAPVYSYVANAFLYNLYITVCICMYSYVTRMYSYVTRLSLVYYSYVTRMYSCVTLCTRMYSYVTRMYSCGVLVTNKKRQLQKKFYHLMRDVSLPL